MDASRSLRHLVVLTAVMALTVLPLGAAAAATTAAADEQSADEQAQGAASMTLTVRPMVGAQPDGGDLVLDPGTGLATLTFVPGGADRQRAVFEFDVANTGQTVLEDVAIEAERIGTVLAGDAGTSLAPGEQTTVRGVLEVTAAEARTGFAGLVALSAVASATSDGATVRAEEVGRLQIVAVLATPSATLDLTVLVDEGDVVAGPGDVPSITWSQEDVDDGVVRLVHLRLTLVNTGPVAIADLAAAVELLGTSAEVALPASLEPGDEAVVDVVREVHPDDVVGVGEDGPVETELTVTATVTGAGADGDAQPVSLLDEVAVLGLVVRPLPEEVVLPVAGPPTRGDLALLALLSIGLGAALLMAAPRPRVA